MRYTQTMHFNSKFSVGELVQHFYLEHAQAKACLLKSNRKENGVGEQVETTSADLDMQRHHNY